jgi:hypothetical protein
MSVVDHVAIYHYVVPNGKNRLRIGVMPMIFPNNDVMCISDMKDVVKALNF